MFVSTVALGSGVGCLLGPGEGIGVDPVGIKPGAGAKRGGGGPCFTFVGLLIPATHSTMKRNKPSSGKPQTEEYISRFKSAWNGMVRSKEV